MPEFKGPDTPIVFVGPGGKQVSLGLMDAERLLIPVFSTSPSDPVHKNRTTRFPLPPTTYKESTPQLARPHATLEPG